MSTQSRQQVTATLIEEEEEEEAVGDRWCVCVCVSLSERAINGISGSGYSQDLHGINC